jgi:hypothetical protein
MEWLLTIDRTSLSLSPLVISNDPFAGNFHLPEDGLERPGFTMRRLYAADSAYFAGRVLLAAVADASTLPAVIYAHAASSAALSVAMAELEAATTQFAYSLTLSIDGEAQTWAADPELPQWGPVDSGLVRAHIARASIAIPINPAGVA